MRRNKDSRLKTIVVLLWLGVLFVTLLGVSYLLYQNYSRPDSSAPAATIPVSLDLPTPTASTILPATLTPLPPVEPTATSTELPTPAPTALPLGAPAVPSPTPTETTTDPSVLLFVGEDGCSIQKVFPSSGEILPVTLHVPSSACRQSSISPDGTRLAYLTAGTSSRLYMMKSDGSGLKRISQSYAYAYAWSPDGKRLAYVGYLADQAALGLYFVNADGSGLAHSSYPEITISGDVARIAWSPDGQWVYAPAENPPGSASFPFVLNVNGSDTLQLSSEAIDPTARVIWSPDSQKVFYLQFGYDFLYAVSMLKILGLDGSHEVLFYDDPSIQGPTLFPKGHFTAGPFWSPDGRLGLMPGKSSIVAGEYQLLVVDAKTRALFFLARLDQPADLAAWSPAGDRIAFLSLPDPQAGGRISLKVVAVDGSGLKTLVEGVGASSPVWITP